MSEKIDTTLLLLEKFGLTTQEAQTYLEIYQGRGDTALILSRTLKLARTKVYRILDSLIAKGLVVTKLGERGNHFTAIPADQLSLLLSDREHELEKLKSLLPTLQLDLTALKPRGPSPRDQVLYFHGIEGLKQVTYNSLHAQGDLLTYELSTMNAFLTKKEAEDFRQKFVERQITSRTLTNATSLEPWTDIVEIVEKYWEIRHLDPKGKPFQFEILIYNDIYCMYRYVGDEIFCVEIHSQELADMQRQIFELLWSSAQKFKILNTHGEAKLV